MAKRNRRTRVSVTYFVFMLISPKPLINKDQLHGGKALQPLIVALAGPLIPVLMALSPTHPYIYYTAR